MCSMEPLFGRGFVLGDFLLRSPHFSVFMLEEASLKTCACTRSSKWGGL